LKVLLRRCTLQKRKLDLLKIIWKQSSSPLLVADCLIIAVHNRYRSTVFARWSQYIYPSNTRFFWPIPLIVPNGSSIGSAVFARKMPHSPYTIPLHHFFQKFASSRDRSEPPPNTPFLGSTPLITPNGISIESAVFLKNIRSLPTDRQTVRLTRRRNGHGTRPISIGRLRYYRATRPNNIFTTEHYSRRVLRYDSRGRGRLSGPNEPFWISHRSD